MVVAVSKQNVSLAVLAAAIVGLSFAVVITRHYVRMEFIKSEEILKQQDKLHTQWQSLQLEYSTLRTEGRVEAIAKNELGMRTPARHEIVNLIVRGGYL